MVFNRQGQFLEDLLNFIESFIHYSLYLKKIYPEEFYTTRTVFGLQIKVVKEGILYDYIHQLVEDLKQILNTVHTIRLNFKQKDLTKEFLDLIIDKSRILDRMDILPPQYERDQIFKSILYKMSQKNFNVNSFELQIITNGQYASSKEQKSCLFEKWVLEKQTINIEDSCSSQDSNKDRDSSVIMIDESEFSKIFKTDNQQDQQSKTGEISKDSMKISKNEQLIDAGHFTELSLIIIDNKI